MDLQEMIESGVEKIRRSANASDDEMESIWLDVMQEWVLIEENLDSIGLENVLRSFDIDAREDVRVQIFMLSMLHKITSDNSYMEKLIKVAMDGRLSPEEMFFVMNQVMVLFFANPSYQITDRVEDLLDDLFKMVIDSYRDELKDELVWIPSKERNRDFVLVLTDQILMIQHGPTKTTLDRCKILMENMGKDVLLINSGTSNPWNHVVLMRSLAKGSYMDDFHNLESINYEGVDIPYIQLENRLPSIDEMRGMIQLVRENKPYQIVVVGGAFYEELLCELIPVMNVSLSPSKLYRTFVNYQQIGRPITDYDRRFLKHRNLPEDHIIVDYFTSHLAPQLKNCTREELGLPKDAKIAVAVGGRLPTEITEEFVEMIKPCLDRGLYLLLLGQVDSLLPKLESGFGNLYSRVIHPGGVEDPLAYLDHCYIYVNPHRMGGGTSCVEAMSKGVPVLTTRYGDVYVNTGDEFGVDDYEHMRQEIFRYMDDEKYHSVKAETARKRAELMLDSVGAFKRVMGEFEKRMLAKEDKQE